MRCLFWLALALLCAAPAKAGLWGLTIHSRANCLNNESITWDRTANHWLWTQSWHYRNWSALQHVVTAGTRYTWRSAAVHWGEGNNLVPPWRVIGYHYRYDALKRRWVNLGVTYATGCNIYDGWWG